MAANRDLFAANLRGLRAEMKLKQSDVADAVGVSVGTIANYENGEGGISYETAWKLADFFGVTLDELGGRTARKTA